MFNNNYKSSLLAASIASALLSLSYSTSVMSEIDSTTGGVFLYGDNIQVGINKHAAFGTDGAYSSQPPYTSRSEELGLLSDPSGNMFSTNAYDGDFFMPGVKEAGWGIRLDGVDYHNTRNNQDYIDLPNITGGVFSDFKDLVNTQEVTWTGQIANKLEVKQYFTLYKKGLTAAIDIEIKNITDAVMTNVYYMHTLDPDNNYRTNNNLKTVNTIVSQGDVKGVAVVSAKQIREVGSDKGESELKLIGYAKNAHVTFGGRFNRNAEAIYNAEGELSNTGSSESDVSISLAYKFDEIAPGETVKFKVGLQLANTAIPELTLDDDNSSNAGTVNAYKTLYIAGGDKKSIVDSDLKITLQEQDKIQGAEISLSNPHENDLIDLLAGSSLPTGITKDLLKSTDSKLVLTGEASIADYETALKNVRYSNSNNLPNLDERIINILVLDKIFTLSNAAQAYVGVVMPVTIDGDITEDNIVNNNEKTAITPSGKATPSLNNGVALVFTDKDGATVESSVSTNDQGIWDTSNAPIDISTLKDGDITLTATTTVNGYSSTASKLFSKDTVIEDIVIVTPSQDQLVSSTDFLVSGTAEAGSKIDIAVDDTHSCTATADENGDWSCSLSSLVLDKTYPVVATATDAVGNKSTASSGFKTPALTLEVLSPKNDTTIGSRDPIVSGKSLPNTEIVVTVGDKNCTAVTDSEGKWECGLTNLPVGKTLDLVVLAKAEDGVTEKSTTLKITVPVTPLVILTPKNDQLVEESDFIVSGTTEPNANIAVKAGDKHSCTTVANDKGEWACKLESLILDTTYPVEVTSSDDAGYKVVATSRFKTPPLLLQVTSPQNNTTVGDDSPLVSGKSLPNTNITVTAGDKNCTVVTDSEGKWECRLNDLPIGQPLDVMVEAKANDGVTTKSTTLKITVPAVPLIISSPQKGQLVEESDLTVSGTTEPNAKLSVKAGDALNCVTTANNKGEWSCQLNGLVLDTNYPLEVTSSLDTGYKAVAASSFKTPPLVLEVISPQNNTTVGDDSPLVSGKSLPNTNITVVAGNERCTALVDAEGLWSCNLNNLPADQSVDIVVTALAEDGVTNKSISLNVHVPAVPLTIISPKPDEVFLSGIVPISGKTDPGAAITVSTGVSGETCTAIADSDGKWTCDLPIASGTVGKKSLNIASRVNGEDEKIGTVSIQLQKDNGSKGSDDGVTTVLKGSGSTSPLGLFFISLALFLMRRLSKK